SASRCAGGVQTPSSIRRRSLASHPSASIFALNVFGAWWRRTSGPLYDACQVVAPDLRIQPQPRRPLFPTIVCLVLLSACCQHARECLLALTHANKLIFTRPARQWPYPLIAAGTGKQFHGIFESCRGHQRLRRSETMSGIRNPLPCHLRATTGLLGGL